MPKTEVPTSVTLYVQWILHPFPTPHVPQQKSANSNWALAKTKAILEDMLIDEREVKLGVQHNSRVLLEIIQPDKQVENGKEFWEEVMSSLKKSNEIISISICVNNDMSEKIATNMADRVPLPWQTGYQGYNSITLIYHQ